MLHNQWEILLRKKEEDILKLRRKLGVFELQNKKKRKKEEKNNVLSNTLISTKNNMLLRSIFMKNPSSIIITDIQGNINLCNESACRLFGYTLEEFKEKRIDDLVPKYVKGHAGLRTGYFKNPSTRHMGLGRDIHALKKDESVFPVEIGLNHINIGGNGYVIAVIIDLTFRNKLKEIINDNNGQLVEENEKLKNIFVQLSCVFGHCTIKNPNKIFNIIGDKSTFIGNTKINEEKDVLYLDTLIRNVDITNNRKNLFCEAWNDKKDYNTMYITQSKIKVVEKGVFKKNKNGDFSFYITLKKINSIE